VRPPEAARQREYAVNVFVSCTSKDLGRFRDEICDRPHEWWGEAQNVPVFRCMGDAKAEDVPPVDWSIREAARADVLVLLLGRHHGALAEEPDGENAGIDVRRLRDLMQNVAGWQEVPQPTRFSYTQWEILAAEAAGVPLLVYSPDRDSTDDDLRPYRECAASEEDWLEHRQTIFANWVRSRTTEDHFRNRTDLLNRVRTGLQRQQRQLRRRRMGILAGAGLAILLAVVLAGYFVHRVAVEQQQEQAQAARIERERRQQASAVALGSSLAMLGQSSAGGARPVFEESLGQLGLPPNQVKELCDQYAALDGAVLDRRLAYDAALADLRPLVMTRVRIVAGERPIPYIRFGYDLSYLKLILQFWEDLASQHEILPAARDALLGLQQTAASTELPGPLAAQIRDLDPGELSEAEGREAVAALLERVLRQFCEPKSKPENTRE